MSSATTDRDPVPAWVRRLDLPVWISDEQHHVLWLNERAAALLNIDAVACIGRRCYEVVAGRAEDGCKFCSVRCAPMQSATLAELLAPVTLEVGAPAQRTWVQALLVPVAGEDGATWLVHCALDAQRTHRVTDYLRRVARRTPDASCEPDARPLTAREREVLRHLAHDEDLPTIAKTLHISLTTVRNHVQHLLAAMGTHSVAEAVARFLLAPGSVNRDLA